MSKKGPNYFSKKITFICMYDILQLDSMLVPELREVAEANDLKGYKKLSKQELIYKILDQQALNTQITPEQVLAMEKESSKANLIKKKGFPLQDPTTIKTRRKQTFSPRANQLKELPRTKSQKLKNLFLLRKKLKLRKQKAKVQKVHRNLQ